MSLHLEIAKVLCGRCATRIHGDPYPCPLCVEKALVGLAAIDAYAVRQEAGL